MNQEKLRASILREARFEFSRSGGPGGQNVNKVNSKVGLRVALLSLEGLSAVERYYVSERLAARVIDGDLVVTSDEERTQEANRRNALGRIEDLIVAAAKVPKKRIPTKPSKASKERRLAEKKGKGEAKRNRSSPKDGQD